MSKSEIIDESFHNINSDYNYVKGSYFGIQFKILAFTFILTAFIKLLNESYIFSFILILFAIVFLFTKYGITISPSMNKYREFYKIFNFKFGKWIPLPEFESISIFNANKSQKGNFVTLSSTVQYKELEVNLVYNRSRTMNVFIAKNYESALEKARLFEQMFKLSIFDASEREGKWL